MGEPERTISGGATHKIVVKKSRFICTLARAATEDEARAVIDSVRKQHWNANHNCSAYRIGPNGRFQRSNDDGEPAGTAGAPMLAVLVRRDLTDTVAIVTRYFGGVLLGAAGLIRAYGQAVSEATDAVGIVERRPLVRVIVEANYADAGRLENALRASIFQLDSVSHGAQVTFQIPMGEDEFPSFETWLAEVTNGQSHAQIAGRSFVEVPIAD